VTLVLDTSVLVAAFLARGTCAEVLEHCARAHEIVSAQPLLDELHDVLVRKFRQRPADARAATALIASRARLVTPAVLDAPVCRDPDDDLVLATAVAGEAEAIVTGDRDLLDLGQVGDIVILAPGEFWRWEAGK